MAHRAQYRGREHAGVPRSRPQARDPTVTPASASTVGVRATGIFFYHSPDSGDVEIEDPDNGECRLLLQGATSADNRTDARATFFLDQLCEEPAGITLDPGDSQGRRWCRSPRQRCGTILRFRRPRGRSHA
ncbi:hypothetical protein AB0H37_27335 [Actinomadura sp. NPDC023710]|uniref:hypothetical protein n=1 Tax=Actinomadura sp. NPDC023710 TaxID=3158219 RepID=UPI0033F11B6B